MKPGPGPALILVAVVAMAGEVWPSLRCGEGMGATNTSLAYTRAYQRTTLRGRNPFSWRTFRPIRYQRQQQRRQQYQQQQQQQQQQRKRRRQEKQPCSSAVLGYKMLMLGMSNVADHKTVCDNSTFPAVWTEQKQEDPVENFFERTEWKKNFASVECGAKVLRSSDNVKHGGHVITRNEDEYLLYTCQEGTFFVIELCETIKVIRLELDNYELYSGTPALFTVRTADQFSNNLADWVTVGQFEASSTKMEVQHFSDLTIKTFGKFVRVDLESFHGSEHYCTLTSFRVFGMTEYECLSINDGVIDVIDEGEEEDVAHEDYSSQMFEISEMINNEKDQTTYFSYKYYFLQMRDDICVDKVGLKTFETNLFHHESDTRTLPDKTNQKQKESVLIGLSNKVKILESNITKHQHNLRNLDTLYSQTSVDLKQILKSIVKADEVFKESAKDSERTKGKVSVLNDKVQSLESELNRLEDLFYIGLGVAAMVVSGLFMCFTLLVCYRTSGDNVQVEKKVQHTTKKVTTTIAVQTDPPQIIKKVSFPEEAEEEVKTSCNDDISTKLFVTRRKKDLSRRVTWCSGSLRRLSTQEPRQTVKEY